MYNIYEIKQIIGTGGECPLTSIVIEKSEEDAIKLLKNKYEKREKLSDKNVGFGYIWFTYGLRNLTCNYLGKADERYNCPWIVFSNF
jgi:hypothetical protein